MDIHYNRGNLCPNTAEQLVHFFKVYFYYAVLYLNLIQGLVLQHLY